MTKYIILFLVTFTLIGNSIAQIAEAPPMAEVAQVADKIIPFRSGNIISVEITEDSVGVLPNSVVDRNSNQYFVEVKIELDNNRSTSIYDYTIVNNKSVNKCLAIKKSNGEYSDSNETFKDEQGVNYTLLFTLNKDLVNLKNPTIDLQLSLLAKQKSLRLIAKKIKSTTPSPVAVVEEVKPVEVVAEPVKPVVEETKVVEKIDMNGATVQELISLGLNKYVTTSIIQKRPYKNMQDLLDKFAASQSLIPILKGLEDKMKFIYIAPEPSNELASGDKINLNTASKTDFKKHKIKYTKYIINARAKEPFKNFEDFISRFTKKQQSSYFKENKDKFCF